MASIVDRGKKVSLECVVPLHTKERVVETTAAIHVAKSIHGICQSAIARMTHSLLITNRHWSSDLSKRVEIPTAQGHELIAVRVDENEEVCISLKNLVAFSESIKFRTVVDFAITSWAVSQTFQYVANGPGLLLFDCSGEPAVFSDPAELEGQRVQVGRLVMWPTDLQFSSDLVHSDLDLYIGEARFFVSSNSMIPIILDVNDQRVGSPLIWGMIAKLYKPW